MKHMMIRSQGPGVQPPALPQTVQDANRRSAPGVVRLGCAALLSLLAACSSKDDGDGPGQVAGQSAFTDNPPIPGSNDMLGENGVSVQPSGTSPGAATSQGTDPAAAGGLTGGGGSREPVNLQACGPDNAAGLAPEQVDQLRAGGDAAGMRYLYPYDGTVFPRGMLAPEVMWEGPEASAVYIHIHSSVFDYEGCLPVTGPGALQLPQDVWEQAGAQTAGPSDPFTVDLVLWDGSAAKGPITEQIVIAAATIKGSVYYNSYISTASFGGTILRIPPGQKAEPFIGGIACVGCHAVSANGQRLVTHSGGEPGMAFALDPMTQPNPPQLAPAPLAGFPGISPDGSVYIASAHPAGLVRPQGTPNEAALINDAVLYETDTGTQLPGSGVPGGAMMPSFSPDGRHIAFNDYGAGAGYALAVMDFDQASRMASNHRVIFMDDGRYPGWPFFLPDSQAVVFARGENPGFTGAGAGVLPGLAGFGGPISDLFLTDLDTGATTILAKAMGLSAADDNAGYLPFGAEELHKHYYPTVSPVAAGGYFWLFFDSIRHYGNKGIHRQLWGSAIRVSADGTYEGDPSHPAFYLSGQEFGTGNHRAFAALDPCKMDGDTCRSGTDCCGGFCKVPETTGEFAVEAEGTCSSEVPECSMINDVCITDDDCCERASSTVLCLAGYCAQPLF